MQGFGLDYFSIAAGGVAGKADLEGEKMVYAHLSDQWIWKPSHFTSGNHLDATQSCFVLN